MSNNDVVSIRVEALGVSITIADGSIAIEQTKKDPVAAVLKAESGRHDLAGLREDSGKSQEAPAAAARQSLAEPLLKGVDNAVSGDSGARNSTPVIDEFHRPSPSSSNGPTGLETQSKPVWSDEEVEKLRALYPTHSASAIAKELGRGRNAVRSKAQNLGLRKDGPPAVTSKLEKPASKPRSLSAAVVEDPVLLPDVFSAVTLFDHHPGQCRWIVSDVWPVMYCGAPVVNSSSWCEQHSKRVFNPRLQGQGANLLPAFQDIPVRTFGHRRFPGSCNNAEVARAG
jgi:hypothetical protein